ncbi:DUF4231 domain-containing protein [Streptomyces sp. NPDC056230]|uniref:DUF4231 domain-containing protein n=1 Tax=Streptomyces sp. NPDC056230 TaxID=3345754 RepID=UPI0035DBBE1C
MPDDAPPAPPADGTEPYPPWVFALVERIEYKGRKLTREDAFKPYPLPSVNWTNIKVFINSASAAGVEWLEPWSVSPHENDQSRALVRFEHNDGGESVWKSVRIQAHRPTPPDPTWGDAVSQTLTSMRRLYQTVPDIRRSPRGTVAVSDPDHYPQPDTEEDAEMEPEEYQSEAGGESEEYEPESDGPQHGSSTGSHAGAESEAGEGSDLRYEPWVYKVLPFLAHDGRTLSAEDASEPFPGHFDWSHVHLFIDASLNADVQELLEWFVFPDHDNLSRATIWHCRNDGSGSLWLGVPIGNLISNDSIQEDSYTWGDVLEETLRSLNHIPDTPEVKYSEASEAPSMGKREILPEETIRTLVDRALEEAFDRGYEREKIDTGEVITEGGHVDAAHVERALAYRRTHAALSNQIRLSRISRFLAVWSALTGILLLSAAAVVNAATWRQVDMRPYNAAGGVLLVLLLVVFVFGRRMDTGQPKGKEPKSVAALKLEVDLLEERRILEASTGARSSKDRQHSYRESIPQEIDRLRRETRRYRRVHNFFQWGLFVASVAMMVTSAVYEQPQPGKAILIGLGAFVSLTTAVTGYFKYRERAFNLQQTSDAIEQHVTAYDLAIPPYNQQDEAANLEKLAENVETLRVEQRKRQQQLEQPNQGQQEVI